MRELWRGAVVVAIGLAVVGGGAIGTSAADNETPVAAGTLDEGADLLPRAGITLDAAVAAAQSAASGPVGEVDFEYFQGQLVFNVDIVDIGRFDVKVDANDGAILGKIADD